MAESQLSSFTKVVFELRIRLDDNPIVLDRFVFVEIFRGGMNRLLLRSLPTDLDPERVELLFQYVQGLELYSTSFEGLSVLGVETPPQFAGLALRFPECRTFQLESASGTGLVFASACVLESGVVEPEDPSFFPMM